MEQAIFATIAYYDHFNYPLTAAEIFQYLIKTNDKKNIIAIVPSIDGTRGNLVTSAESAGLLRLRQRADSRNDSGKPAFSEILKILDNSEKLKKALGRKNGFYFLTGREEIIASRIRRKKLTDEKFKSAGRRTKWILHFISYIPFVRLIMASGTMALGNPGKESDIDLLIAAKHGRIWTTRALLTFFALAFGVYRHKEETENRLCFNHYITDKSLAIDFGNLYKAQEYLNLIPIAGDIKLYGEFLAANREWTKNYVWFTDTNSISSMRTFQVGGAFLFVKKFFELVLSGKIGDIFEKMVKKFQIYFIEKNPLSSNPSARIKYTDENLVFHPILVEPEIIAEYEEKISRFNKGIT